MPRYVHRLQFYEGKEPLFCKYNLDEEIAKIHRRRVALRSGGSIVIDQTEALVAIDVNSGSFRAEGDAEEEPVAAGVQAALREAVERPLDQVPELRLQQPELR